MSSGKPTSSGCDGCREIFAADLEKAIANPAPIFDFPAPEPLPVATPIAEEPRMIDPVCGMKVLPSRAKGGSHAHAGETYFCNPRCDERFRADPQSFSAPKPSVTAPPLPAQVGAEYICPMDPEVLSDRPGPWRPSLLRARLDLASDTLF
ncbi:MAG: hypothetical protein ABI193_17735 [Minicystis sp.]